MQIHLGRRIYLTLRSHHEHHNQDSIYQSIFLSLLISLNLSPLVLYCDSFLNFIVSLGTSK